MRSDQELAFVIDHYRLPIPLAARRLILQRARLAEERQRRPAGIPSLALAAGDCLDEPVGHRSEPPGAAQARATPAG
jgi:hypothetical protein